MPTPPKLTADLQANEKLRRLLGHQGRRTAPPLALPVLPRLTARLSLAQPLSRTDILRRATFDQGWRR